MEKKYDKRTLKKCPFCGSKCLVGINWQIVCCDCDARGPVQTKHDSFAYTYIELWNKAKR